MTATSSPLPPAQAEPAKPYCWRYLGEGKFERVWTRDDATAEERRIGDALPTEEEKSAFFAESNRRHLEERDRSDAEWLAARRAVVVSRALVVVGRPQIRGRAPRPVARRRTRTSSRAGPPDREPEPPLAGEAR
jgi:hypothetical protein